MKEFNDKIILNKEFVSYLNKKKTKEFNKEKKLKDDYYHKKELLVKIQQTRKNELKSLSTILKSLNNIKTGLSNYREEKNKSKNSQDISLLRRPSKNKIVDTVKNNALQENIRKNENKSNFTSFPSCNHSFDRRSEKMNKILSSSIISGKSLSKIKNASDKNKDSVKDEENCKKDIILSVKSNKSIKTIKTIKTNITIDDYIGNNNNLIKDPLNINDNLNTEIYIKNKIPNSVKSIQYALPRKNNSRIIITPKLLTNIKFSNNDHYNSSNNKEELVSNTNDLSKNSIRSKDNNINSNYVNIKKEDSICKGSMNSFNVNIKDKSHSTLISNNNSITHSDSSIKLKIKNSIIDQNDSAPHLNNKDNIIDQTYESIKANKNRKISNNSIIQSISYFDNVAPTKTIKSNKDLSYNNNNIAENNKTLKSNITKNTKYSNRFDVIITNDVFSQDEKNNISELDLINMDNSLKQDKIASILPIEISKAQVKPEILNNNTNNNDNYNDDREDENKDYNRYFGDNNVLNGKFYSLNDDHLLKKQNSEIVKSSSLSSSHKTKLSGLSGKFNYLNSRSNNSLITISNKNEINIETNERRNINSLASIDNNNINNDIKTNTLISNKVKSSLNNDSCSNNINSKSEETILTNIIIESPSKTQSKKSSNSNINKQNEINKSNLNNSFRNKDRDDIITNKTNNNTNNTNNTDLNSYLLNNNKLQNYPLVYSKTKNNNNSFKIVSNSNTKDNNSNNSKEDNDNINTNIVITMKNSQSSKNINKNTEKYVKSVVKQHKFRIPHDIKINSNKTNKLEKKLSIIDLKSDNISSNVNISNRYTNTENSQKLDKNEVIQKNLYLLLKLNKFNKQ